MNSRYVRSLIQKIRVSRVRKRWLQEENKMSIIRHLPPLNRIELKQIRQTWGGIPFSTRHLQSYRLYKAVRGFDSRFLPMPLYDPSIIRVFNPKEDAAVFVNKGLFERLFSELKQPQCFFKRINSNFYVQGYQVADLDYIIDYWTTLGSFVIKPSKNSHGGVGVRVFNRHITKDEAILLIQEYKDDFLVQEVVRQHDETSVFNKTSINTIRIISLYLNGRVSILRSSLRIGLPGSVVDNAGAGGIMVGLDEYGRLFDFGITQTFEKIWLTANGIEFSGRRVTAFPKIRKIVIENHAFLYPTLGMVAWDFAVGADGSPIFLEGNTKVPGIFWIQFCTGPIFGERTQEVVNYCKSNNDIYS